MLPAQRPKPAERPLSQILEQIAADTSRDRIVVADLMTAMHDRAISALILVFAFPNAVPLPPGATSILGAPLLFLTGQLAFGRPPWLPRWVMQRSMNRAHFAVLVQRLAPWLARAERLLRPRAALLVRPPAEFLIGLICLLLSVILVLPIPMGNMLPAIAICVFALSLLQRDGLWAIFGLGVTGAAMALVWGVLLGLFESGRYVLSKMFG
jgi:hypothetical protein